MPSKQSYITYFIVISLILVVVQYFVYWRFKRSLRRDFPKQAKKLIIIVRIVFVVMNVPLLMLFFRKLTAALTPITNMLLIPYTVWQGLMFVWMLVLIAVSLFGLGRSLIRNLTRRQP